MRYYQMKTNLIYLFFFSLILLGCNEDSIGLDIKGNLSGTVISDETDEPLENVKISTNPASSTTFTDADGTFMLNDILVDDYAVQAELDGFRTAFESVAITEDATSTVAIEMSVAADNNVAPSKPNLLSPEDGATNVDTQVEFIWQSNDDNGDEITYDLELRNGATGEIRNFEVVQDTTLVVENLRLSTTYFWGVSADDGVNPSVNSDISSFTTVNTPGNDIVFTKQIEGNGVIFSGGLVDDPGNEDGMPDFNLFRLTSLSSNSFRPKKSNEARKIAFLRSVGGETHIFTMDFSGDNVFQVTRNIPVAGFRQSELNYTWSQDGSQLYYSNFDKLYAINIDGTGGLPAVYETPDGSLISEIAVPDFENNLVLLKTNNLQGYEVNMFTLNLNTQTLVNTIPVNADGAVGSIDISADGNLILYSKDIDNAINNQYRIFNSRLFTYNISSGLTTMIDTDAQIGFNEVYGSLTPNEGGVIFTRVSNNIGGTPEVILYTFTDQSQDENVLLFNDAYMPDFE